MVMCVLLMLISSWVYAVVAMMFAGVIYHYIQVLLFLLFANSE